MLNDPLWKRALKAVVEIKDPPPPPPPEPVPQAAWDELDGALKMQERREARQRLNPAPPPVAPPPQPPESPVDADGLVNFDALYQQAGVPTVPFTAEQALDMLGHMPAGVSEEARQQVINVTLAALGRSVGGTPEAIVADATRKQAALQAFRRTRGDQLADLTTAAEGRIASACRAGIPAADVDRSPGWASARRTLRGFRDPGSRAGRRRRRGLRHHPAGQWDLRADRRGLRPDHRADHRADHRSGHRADGRAGRVACAGTCLTPPCRRAWYGGSGRLRVRSLGSGGSVGSVGSVRELSVRPDVVCRTAAR